MASECVSTSEIPLNDFRRQWDSIEGDVLAATRRVGSRGWYILGEEVAGFERALAAHVGRRAVVGCGNGMDAIEIALRATGLRPGDEVLTTPLSAFATTLAVVRAGGVPVFVDVDGHGLLDFDAAGEALRARRSIRYLIPVHLYGHALNLGVLRALRDEFGVIVIEDCCQAVGAGWQGTPVGSVGSASALSFYPTKNLGALGDGGALLTDDPAIEAAARSLRDYGQSARYRHDRLGLNSRLDELHAGILATALLPRLTVWTERRRSIAAVYLRGIMNEHVRVLPNPENSDSVWHLFPVLVEPSRREAFRAHLRALGVSSAVHYPELIPSQRALGDFGSVTVGELTVARRIAGAEVSLPIHPFMRPEEVERVVAAANSWRPS